MTAVCRRLVGLVIYRVGQKTGPQTRDRLKYVATLPCNLSLLACCADINISQGSVATYAGYGWVFNVFLTANLPRNRSEKKILNRLRF